MKQANNAVTMTKEGLMVVLDSVKAILTSMDTGEYTKLTDVASALEDAALKLELTDTNFHTLAIVRTLYDGVRCVLNAGSTTMQDADTKTLIDRCGLCILCLYRF